MRPSHASISHPALRYCPKAIHAAAFPSRTDETKVPHAVCPRITQQITLAFGVDIDKDVVRRILGKHYGLESGSDGPSWLTFLGQAKDSLGSMDLFRAPDARGDRGPPV